jgi:hypothetical protein
MAPQIIYITLAAISFAMACYKYGKSKDTPDFLGSLLAVAINVSLLIWGGFFDILVK